MLQRCSASSINSMYNPGNDWSNLSQYLLRISVRNNNNIFGYVIYKLTFTIWKNFKIFCFIFQPTELSDFKVDMIFFDDFLFVLVLFVLYE